MSEWSEDWRRRFAKICKFHNLLQVRDSLNLKNGRRLILGQLKNGRWITFEMEEMGKIRGTNVAVPGEILVVHTPEGGLPEKKAKEIYVRIRKKAGLEPGVLKGGLTHFAESDEELNTYIEADMRRLSIVETVDDERNWLKHIYKIFEPTYDNFVDEIFNCPGGCLRGRNNAKPMLRPAGGFRVPSDVMFVLQKSTRDDDQNNKCLTMGKEDYVRGVQDETAKGLTRILDTIGLSYKNIYIINSLLCWQYDNKKVGWDNCWLPCLNQGWLRQSIDICKPRIIVSFGIEALQSVHYALGQRIERPKMSDEVNKARMIRGIHIYPLFHTSPNARQTRSLEQQKRDWIELKAYIDNNRLKSHDSEE